MIEADLFFIKSRILTIILEKKIHPLILKLRCAIFLLIVSFTPAFKLLAQATQNNSSDVIEATSQTRAEMQQHYVDERARSSSFLYPAPYFHIIPKKNMITTTASITNLDITIVPKYNKAEKKRSDNPHYLYQKGWEASPLVGFSADRFGIGFASEFGQKESSYHFDYTDSNGGSTWWEQNSKIKYSGLGLYLYWLPEARFLPDYINPTFIFGYKRLNVLHSYAARSSQFSVDYKDYRYQVKKLDSGFNLSINLAKYFTVIPWLNYTNRLIEAPKNGDSSEAQEVNIDLVADQIFFWDSTPRYVWGIDFAVTISQVDLHLGGIFGLIDSMAKGSDRIVESNISLSVTYNIKAR